MNILSFFHVNGLIWMIETSPGLVALITAGLVFLSGIMEREGNRKLLTLYAAGLLYITILSRPAAPRRAVLTLFWSYRHFCSDLYFRREIINNICLFIPLGAMLCRLFPLKYAFFLPTVISAGIELLQYISGRGFGELDDILSNTIGGLIGIALAMILTLTWKLLQKKMSCSLYKHRK